MTNDTQIMNTYNEENNNVGNMLWKIIIGISEYLYESDDNT